MHIHETDVTNPDKVTANNENTDVFKSKKSTEVSRTFVIDIIIKQI